MIDRELRPVELRDGQSRSAAESIRRRDRVNVKCLAAALALVALPMTPAFAEKVSPQVIGVGGEAATAPPFPISVWYQNPVQTGTYYKSTTTQAAATKAIGANLMLGFMGYNGSPTTWPESYGADHGQLALLTSLGIDVMSPLYTDYTSKTSATSVNSVLALISKVANSSTMVMGYNLGDEPTCAQAANIPSEVAAIKASDPTRIVTFNHTAWVLAPQFSGCTSTLQAALQATSVASADDYPLINAYTNPLTFTFPESDFNSTSNDTLWRHMLMVAGLRHFALSGEPVWAFQDTGNDALGFAEANGSIISNLTSGSTTLTLVPTGGAGWPKFTSRWVGMGLVGSGIPSGTTIAALTDASHVVMSHAATLSETNKPVAVVGGVHNSDCIAAVNLCLVNGNEYRATAAEVAAEAWGTVISDGDGIEWFPQDLNGAAWALGDQSVVDPAASRAAAANLAQIDRSIQTYAAVIGDATAGVCSMQSENYATGAYSKSTHCSNGILTMATADNSVPGLALAKTHSGALYVFAQSDRRSTNGAVFTFTLSGHSGQTATVVYDSNQHYDPAHSAQGSTFVLNRAAQFSDALGAFSDDYQVKIYRVQ